MSEKEKELLEEEPVIETEAAEAETEAAEEQAEPLTAEQQQIADLQAELDKARKQSDDYLDRLRRTMAEFDNFRKRTGKEKEQERMNGQIAVISTVLDLLDNFERAMAAFSEEDEASPMGQGIRMVYKQFVDALKGIGVEEIPALGENFDPEKHNAVQHIEDETIDENIVCEVFQKGYTFKGKVVRYSMVKVAN
ncbi:MAG: nucleotide exchange factor GrpE [Firmicutes bacterium]|nr:nucleotide exchange factor GrpE [Bacillota bacterium]